MIQEIFKDNSEKAPRIGKTKTSLLSGILRCKCGASMRITYSSRVVDGKKPYYYVCSAKNTSAGILCKSKNLNGFKTDQAIIEQVRNVPYDKIKNEFDLLMPNTDPKNLEKDIVDIEKQRTNINTQISRLIPKLSLTDDEEVSKILLDQVKELKNQLNEIDEKIQATNESQANIYASHQLINEMYSKLKDFNENFDNMTIEEKKNLLREIFEYITWDSDTNTINFGFNLKKLDEALEPISSIPSFKNSVSHFSSSCQSILNSLSNLFHVSKMIVLRYSLYSFLLSTSSI